MSRGNGHVYIPSLEPFQMFQGHESNGPDGVALRWMRGGMYGILPEPGSGTWTQVMGASAHLRPQRVARDLGGRLHGVRPFGISQTSRAVRERRVERLLWRIVGRTRKSIGEEQSVCLIGHSDQRAEC
jgi:hypothetical protein